MRFETISLNVQLIEIEGVPGAGRIPVEKSRDFDDVVARRDTAAYFQIRGGPDVFVQVEIVRGRDAIYRDAHPSAVAIEEGSQLQIVRPRVRVQQDHLANV